MGSNAGQRLCQFVKNAGANIRRSLPPDFPTAQKSTAKVAQDGQLNFKSSGWINSCWVQFGRLGNNSPKSKFAASFHKPHSSSEHLSSSWNTLFSRSFRRSAVDRLRGRRHKAQESEQPSQVPQCPPVPTKFTGMDRLNLIYKPIAFTALIGTGSIIGCTIWQYEEYRKHVSGGRFSLSNLTVPGFGGAAGDQAPQRQSSQWRLRVLSWWNGLTPGEKVFWPICAINGLVCLAWRLPFLTHTMVSYFSCNPMGRAVCWPMLLSTFSHYSFFHLCANMFVLHSFIPAAAQIMGKEQFVALYLTSGTVASLGSHFHKLIVCSNVPSLGASGAIMGILGLVCTRMPDIQLGIIFLPGIQFTADTALKCMLAVDTAGLLFGWRMMDHAAHLAGCLFGIGFSSWGKDTFWAFRDFIMTRWHKLRTQGVL